MGNELVKRDERMSSVAKLSNKSGYEYIMEQMDLMRTKFNLSPTMVETHMIVRDKDNGHLILRKIENQISVFDLDPVERKDVIVGMSKTYSERTGLDAKNGKYNDEHRLLPGEALSIDVGEIEAWANI